MSFYSKLTKNETKTTMTVITNGLTTKRTEQIRTLQNNMYDEINNLWEKQTN